MNPYKYFEIAAKFATLKEDLRTHRLGAVGVRSDGVLVGAYNAPAPDKTPLVHAEARLARKLDKGATVFVARVAKSGIRLARPCASCQAILKAAEVERVYYTISEKEYGVIDFL
jgi:tRNA(Arg) A34 adenosine deaminase TadA